LEQASFKPVTAAQTQSWLGRWRTSMFWRIVPAMFFSSCIGTAFVTFGTAVYDNVRLHGTLGQDRLKHRLEAEFARSAPLLAQHDMSPLLCETVLETLAARVLSDLPDGSGPNGFNRAVQEGRLALSFDSPSGPACSYPSGRVSASLREAMSAAIAHQRKTAVPEQSGKAHDGWTSAVAIAPNDRPDAVLAAGFYALSPVQTFLQADLPWVVLIIYILTINSLSALTLVLLIVRRIRRAERAAAAWTQGELDIRINDPQQDEFARLARRFDVMADSMAGVIEVKQALAAAEERNRLAQDLHDTAKQRAFAVGLQLSAAKNIATSDSRTAALINGALSLTNHLQHDLADVIRRLSAPTIAEWGLRNALMEGINGLLSGSQISWKLMLSEHDERVISGLPDVPRQLFLITMEAAANTLKHARSTQFAVSCRSDDSTYNWIIVDDGQGFDLEQTAGTGMGLSNMRLRASSLPDGAISISSRKGVGTSIDVTFNYKKIT
jgi:two-component system NarL family sensor kinase